MFKQVNVNLRGDYPIYKKINGELVRLSVQELGKRYSLTTNFETGETYFLQFSDEEEMQAEQQRIDWEAGATERAVEEKRQQEEREHFENGLKYETRIVAYLDILGWAAEVEKAQDDVGVVRGLGKTLALLKSIAEFHNSLRGLLSSEQKWPGNPMMTQFSDSLVISLDDDRNGRDTLQSALHQLTTVLGQHGFLLRGGVVKGKLYHADGLVFGPALNEAYNLESKVAITPRVILSKELADAWQVHSQREIEMHTKEQPWMRSSDDYYFFNFLPPFMGNSFFTDSKFWHNRLNCFRNLILLNAKNKQCSDHVFAKYEWLARYLDSVCFQYPLARGLEVLQEAMVTRQLTNES